MEKERNFSFRVRVITGNNNTHTRTPHMYTTTTLNAMEMWRSASITAFPIMCIPLLSSYHFLCILFLKQILFEIYIF